MNNQQTPTIAIRVNTNNPDHHLYRNNGTWWIHYTVHLPDYTAHRVRKSLETRDRRQARQRRDHWLARLKRGGVES